ncbi:RNA polymerase sigma-70 factor, ECF subfamily [Enterococcus sp. DIV0213j]|jgi:RNA polymerase sigma-70 factor (ECF subfamily)
MYRVALSYTHKHEDALDVIQESFKKALTYFAKAEDITDFRPWFFRILVNTGKDDWRKRKRTPESNELPEELSMPAIDQLTMMEIAEVLEKLGSPEKEILILKFFEGFTLNEISIILDLNTNTVKTKMYRALNQLRTIIDEGVTE